MAMQYYHRYVYRQYRCPKCNSLLKSEPVHDHMLDYGNDGCIMFLCYLMFLPLTLLYLLIKLIVKIVKEKRRKFTKNGDEAIFCKHCNSYIALTYKGAYEVPKEDIKKEN